MGTQTRNSKRSSAMNIPATRSGRGNHSHYKLYLGWQHYQDGTYKIVTVKKGGGTRQITYETDKPLSLETIIQEGKKRFFPSGESKFGNFSEMEIAVANFTGDNISEFQDLEGNSCSFQEYLTAHGLYSSQCHMYLRTKPKKDQIQNFHVNGMEAGVVTIKYQKSNLSKYDDNNGTTLVCSSTLCCYNAIDHHEDFEQFHPQDHGFVVTEIEKDNTKYQVQSVEGSENMLYGPDIIHGVEEDNQNYLVMAATPILNLNYLWKKNDELIYEGNRPILAVKEEGIYSLTIETEHSQLFVGQPVVVTVNISKPTSLSSSLPSSALSSSVQHSGILQTVDPSTQETTEQGAMTVDPLAYVSSPSQRNSSVQLSSILQTVAPSTQETTEHGAMTVDPLAYLSSPSQRNSLVQLSSILQTVAPSTQETTEHGAMTVDPLAYLSSPSQRNSLVQLSSILQALAPSTHETTEHGAMTVDGDDPLAYVSSPSQQNSSVQLSSILQTMAPSTQETTEYGAMTVDPLAYVSSPSQQNSSVQRSSILQTVAPSTQETTEHGAMTVDPLAYVSSPSQRNSSVQLSSILQTVTPSTQETTERGAMTVDPLAYVSSPSQRNSSVQLTCSSILQTVAPTTQETTEHGAMAADPLAYVHVSSPSQRNSSVQLSSILQTVAPTTQETTEHEAMTVDPLAYVSSPSQRNSSMPSCAMQECSIVQNQMVSEQPHFSSVFPILEGSEPTSPLLHIPSNELIIEREINRGAFGVVSKAQWNGTSVAVKQVPVKRMKKMKAMLARELQISAAVRHPNIILLMGYSIERNQLNLISEYVNGPNLDQVLFDEGELNFSYDKKVVIAYQISAAVSYLHSRCPVILHRDIKPENIVLTKSLNSAKLCDLGLSKVKTMNTLITTVASGHSSQPGTPIYQAPEVLLSGTSASSKTDVWSLCATLVELFSEDTVWETHNINDENDDARSVEHKVCNCMRSCKTPDGLTALLAMDLPPEMKDVMLFGLKYEPESRPVAVEICMVFRKLCERFDI